MILKAAGDLEIKLNNKLSKLFDESIQNVIKKLISIGKLDPAKFSELMDLINNGPELQKILSRDLNMAANKAGQNVVSQLREGGITASATKFSENTRSILENHAFEASQRTLDRVRGNVMQNLTESYQEGYGIDKAAAKLKTDFTKMKKYELKRVARTEINSAQNLGSYETMEDLNVEFQRWISAHDRRVRGNDPKDKADHRKMDGQIVRVGDKFSNGLRYPGDRNGRIEEWINCRCTLGPFIMPYGKKAPDKRYFYEEDLLDDT